MARITRRPLVLVSVVLAFVASIALSSGGCGTTNEQWKRNPLIKVIGTAISGDQVPVHAVVDSASFGEPPTYEHKLHKWSDVRIGNSFPFVESERTRRVYLLIQGILHS